MSEWTPPEGATTADYRGRSIAPERAVAALVGRMKNQAAEARDRFSNLLSSAGVHVTEAGMVIKSSLAILGSMTVNGSMTVSGTARSADFDGNLAAGDPGTTGWAMNASRVAIGELILRPGSVGNDTLANPIDLVGAATVTTGLWAVGTSMSNMATTTLTVPAGFSQAFVMAQASMHFQDSAPNGGWVRAVIGGSAGGEMGGLANLNLGQSAFHSTTLTGLSGGGTITLACQVRASVASAVATGRIAQIAGFGVFFR